MRRTILMVATIALTLLVASGVALALTKIGTDGRDFLKGTNGADTLIGKGGNDALFARRGNDDLLGGPSKDVLFGGTERRAMGGDKNLAGGTGNDAVLGGKGSDNLVGGEGNDYVVGGDYNSAAVKDTISGGDGKDVIDVFNFNNNPGGNDVVSCGSGVDWVLANRNDVVAPDCEKVFVGERRIDPFVESIPENFFEGLYQF